MRSDMKRHRHTHYKSSTAPGTSPTLPSTTSTLLGLNNISGNNSSSGGGMILINGNGSNVTANNATATIIGNTLIVDEGIVAGNNNNTNNGHHQQQQSHHQQPQHLAALAPLSITTSSNSSSMDGSVSLQQGNSSNSGGLPHLHTVNILRQSHPQVNGQLKVSSFITGKPCTSFVMCNIS